MRTINNAKAANKTDKTSFSQNETFSIGKELIKMVGKREQNLENDFTENFFQILNLI